VTAPAGWYVDDKGATSVWASVFVVQTFETVFWMVTTRQM